MGIDNPSDGSFQGNADPGQISGDPKTVKPAQVQPGEQTKGDQQQTFVTADQLDQKFKDLDKNIQRQLQSYGDKTENRLATQIQEANALLESRFVDLESRGIKVPEKFKEEERTRVLQEGLAASEPPSLIDVAGLQVDERYINDVNYVNYTAYQMANQAGFIVGKDDPEFASLASKGTGQEYLETYRKAINDKAARTGVTLPSTQPSSVPEQETKPVVPGGTIPAGGGEVPANWADETDPHKLIAMGLAEMD
jgi:hypothetical protein